MITTQKATLNISPPSGFKKLTRVILLRKAKLMNEME
jgi:hypothetical protein